MGIAQGVGTKRALHVRRLPLLVLSLFLAAPLAAQTSEERAFVALQKQFQDGLYEFAARDAASFPTQFTNSARLAEVILIQAQALLELGKAPEALAALEAHAGLAGARADDFAFWRAQAIVRLGQPAAAADAFRQLETDFPDSPRRLEAAVQEALARSQLGETAAAATRLRDPQGTFQTAATADPGSVWAWRGWLLLARLSTELKETAGAEDALRRMAAVPLPADVEWERQLALARVRVAAGNLPEALGHTTNLWTNATNLVPPSLLAEAAALQGGILERLEHTDAAIAAYDRNLATNAPADQRRFALDKVITLSRSQGPTAVVQRLQAFIDRHPQDDFLDLARFALGEAQLREYQRLAAPDAAPTPEITAARTNALTQARTQFEWVLANRPQSPLVGRAELNRGWCFWEEGPSRWTNALVAFRTATSRLAPSAEQADARFKWADCQARLGDWTGALTNFWLVATNLAGLPRADTVRVQALFRIVQTGIQAGDLPAAAGALPLLTQLDAAGETAQRAELLLATAFSRLGQPESARAQYEGFLQRYTNSTFIPEVRLAIARTFEQRADNGAALSAYAAWLAQHTNQAGISSNLVAQATFDLARVRFRSSPDAAAVGLLTNFLARFPGDTNAPLAQYLVADHAFGAGDYARAERLFRDRLLEPGASSPGAELPYRARLMAGKAAVFRQGWQNAREHFDWIITNGPLYVVSSPIPVPVVAEAYLARGDLFLLEPRDAAADPLAGYAEATNAFAKVALQFPQTEWAPRAWGGIGNCSLQLATAEPARYEDAAEAYRKVVESNADAALRSMAEVALGLVREKQGALEPEVRQAARYDAALTHYLNVFYEKNLRPGEVADPAWLKQAGLSAVKLAESLKRWDVALGLHERLIAELPPLRARFEKRIEELRALASAPNAGAR